MSRWQPWDIIDGGYADADRPWSSQETVNYLPVPAEQAGTLSAKKLVCPPGLVEFCDLGTDAPVRGTWNAEGTFLAVSGSTLFRVAPDGSKTTIGTVPGVGRVCFAHNKLASGAHQVVIANVSSGYVYNTGDNSFVQITDPGFPGAVNVAFVDGYIAFNDPFGRFWGTSDLQNALEYNTLDRYDAESQPDPILGLTVSHREVNAFGTRTGEFFRNTGGATGTFQRIDGAETEVGIANAYSWALLDNTVYWLGNDGLVYRYVNGHLPQIVSNGPIASLIAQRNMANAFAFTWEDRKHKVFYLTFPDGETIGYDVWTDRWHRRQSYGMERWRVNTLTKFQGNDWIAGDFANGKLYRLDWSAQHEAGAHLVSRRRFPVAADGGNALLINAIKLMFNTGQGSYPAMTITGDLPSGTVGQAGSLQYQVAGGIGPHTFTIDSGSLPPGATMNSAGLVTYTYSTNGAYAWVVKVTDAFGETALHADSATVSLPAGYEWEFLQGMPVQQYRAGITSDTSIVLISQSSNSLVVTHDLGATFSTKAIPWSGVSGCYCPGLGPNVGRFIVSRGFPNVVYSDDDGETWTAQNTTNSDAYVVTLWNGKRIIRAGQNGAAEYSATGLTGSWVNSPATIGGAISVAFGQALVNSTGNGGVVVLLRANGSIVRSVDGGSTYSLCTINSDPAAGTAWRGFTTDGITWRAYKYDGASTTYVYTSVDAGSTWNVTTFTPVANGYTGGSIKFMNGLWVGGHIGTTTPGNPPKIFASTTGLPPFNDISVLNANLAPANCVNNGFAFIGNLAVTFGTGSTTGWAYRSPMD